VEAAVAEIDSLDVLVNNAAICVRNTPVDTTGQYVNVAGVVPW
jgi:NAD(P)-dependent dehydrogenase (short-subunit alcohol dehydrogenase family)